VFTGRRASGLPRTHRLRGDRLLEVSHRSAAAAADVEVLARERLDHPVRGAGGGGAALSIRQPLSRARASAGGGGRRRGGGALCGCVWEEGGVGQVDGRVGGRRGGAILDAQLRPCTQRTQA
jgi:hypothetical protein